MIRMKLEKDAKWYPSMRRSEKTEQLREMKGEEGASSYVKPTDFKYIYCDPVVIDSFEQQIGPDNVPEFRQRLMMDLKLDIFHQIAQQSIFLQTVEYCGRGRKLELDTTRRTKQEMVPPIIFNWTTSEEKVSDLELINLNLNYNGKPLFSNVELLLIIELMYEEFLNYLYVLAQK